MSNRRAKMRQEKRRQKASRDPAEYSEGQAARSARSWVQWLLLSTKVVVGISLLVGAVVALAFGVHHYARTTPRFAISRIEIHGTKRLARQDVLRAAGFDRGMNLFALDIEETETRLLESPWISTVRVTRRLPNAVVLEVAEREAVAVAVIEQETFLVSQEGAPFKTLGSGDPHDLPLVTGISAAALAKDRRAEQGRLVDALALLRDYERLAIAQDFPVQEIHLERTGAAVMTIGQKGVSLVLGEAPWKRKLLRAERVLTKSRRAGGKPGVVFLDNEAHPERVVLRVGGPRFAP